MENLVMSEPVSEVIEAARLAGNTDTEQVDLYVRAANYERPLVPE